MISVTIPGVPVPKGRPRFTLIGRGASAHVRTYTPPETEAAEKALALQSRKYKPAKPLSGALRVDTIFVVPKPARVDASRSQFWPHVKPDDDNYRKLVLDALNGMFWHDDGQVCGGSSVKIYGHPPRTIIRISQLTADDARELLREIGEDDGQAPMFGGMNG